MGQTSKQPPPQATEPPQALGYAFAILWGVLVAFAVMAAWKHTAPPDGEDRDWLITGIGFGVVAAVGTIGVGVYQLGRRVESKQESASSPTDVHGASVTVDEPDFSGDTPTNAPCAWCGYSLSGLPGKLCPECGRRPPRTDGAALELQHRIPLIDPESWPQSRPQVPMWATAGAVVTLSVLIGMLVFTRGLIDPAQTNGFTVAHVLGVVVAGSMMVLFAMTVRSLSLVWRWALILLGLLIGFSWLVVILL